MSDEPKAKPNRGTSLNVVGWLAMGLFLVVVVGVHVLKGDSGHFVAEVVGGLFVAAVPAIIAGWISRGNRWAINITLAATIVSLMTLGAVSALLVNARNDAVLAKYDVATEHRMAKSHELLERHLAGEDTSVEQVNVLGDFLSSSKQAAKYLGGRDQKIMMAMTEVTSDIQHPLADYSAAFEAFNEAGGIDSEGIESRAQIATRLALLDAFSTANERFDAAYANMEPQLAARLNSIDLTPKDVSKIVDQWKQGSQPDLIRQIRATARALVVSYRGLLQALDSFWGQWQVDGEDTLFHTDEGFAQYNKYFEQMQNTIDQQTQLQQELLDRAKAAQQRQ
jgi:hypothetical protein